jgi:putative membrane protein
MFYMHHSAGWGWGWWVLMTFGMVAFWAILVYAALCLARGGRPSDDARHGTPERPEEILKRRLAQGEISLDEYERLVEALHDPDRARAGAG